MVINSPRVLKERGYRVAVLVPGTCCGRISDLGSDGGFLKELLPDCITAEIFCANGVGMALDARVLPLPTHRFAQLP